MASTTQIIHIQPLAPPKPPVGAPCNGCGVCCLAEPCPLGAVLSGRRSGACDALRWSDADHIYRCGAVGEPVAVLRAALPAFLCWLAQPLAWGLAKLAHRWIAAGTGCDCSIVPEPVASTTMQAPSEPTAP